MARPHPVRSETEVAAEVVMILFAKGLLGSGAPALLRVHEITGIPVAELRAAWQRNESRGYRPPFGMSGAPTAETPQAIGLRNANQARWQKKNPSPGKRRCSRCQTVKATTEFGIKNQRTGQLKSWCIPCLTAYQQERYVRLHEVGIVAAIRVVLAEGSPFLGEACPRCTLVLAVGQEIEVHDVELRHVNCHQVVS